MSKKALFSGWFLVAAFTSFQFYFSVTPSGAEANVSNKKGHFIATSRDNSIVPAVALAPPTVTTFDQEEVALAATKPKPTDAKDPAFRKVASDSRRAGSEDLLSDEFKKFRDGWIKLRDAESLDAMLTKYDASYEQQPADLQYVIARLSPLLAMRGFYWRAASLAHQSVVSQELSLSLIRAFAEQSMNLQPDSQWEAIMAFMSIPNSRQLVPPSDKGDGVKRYDERFYVENDMSDFFATEVYNRLAKAITRLSELKLSHPVNGKDVPNVFDNKIRFGDDAFNQSPDAYDAEDRYVFIGDAERLSAMARFHRRMATICQMAAYNLNGYIALRKDIGKAYGIDAELTGKVSGMLDGVGDFFGGVAALKGGVGEALSIEGVTRSERIAITAKHKTVLGLRDARWMKLAYQHMAAWALYTSKVWNDIRNDKDGMRNLLDPDFFMGRKDQNDKAMANLLQLFPKKGGDAKLYGAVSGDMVSVNMYNFFNNPPSNLKQLMPTVFMKHEDVEPLKNLYSSFEPGKNVSTVKMKMSTTVGGKAETKWVEWRNYLYGRAVGWDPNVYGSLFPGVKTPEQVARAQRVLYETRGARPVMNTLLVFVK